MIEPPVRPGRSGLGGPRYLRRWALTAGSLVLAGSLSAALAQTPAAPSELPPPTVLPEGTENAPAPRLFDVPGSDCADGQSSGRGRQLGSAPRPNAETLKQFNQYVEETIDPQNTLDLVLGQPRLLIFKDVPQRIQLPDDTTATYTVVSQRELSVIGKKVGSTVLNLWFGDPKDAKKQTILSYLVRVLPNPGDRSRLEAQLKVLQDDINRAFCNSVICLKLVGNKIVVSGEAHDVHEAAQIIRIIGVQTGGAQNQNRPSGTQINQVTQVTPGAPIPPVPESAGVAPGPPEIPGIPGATPEGGLVTPSVENYAVPNFPNIINLLHVPGEQQVMLKVVVAEVNRDAARSIGLNFTVSNNSGTQVFGQLTGPIGATTGGSGATTGVGTATSGSVNLPLTLDNGLIPVRLNALRSLSLSRTLAEPDLVTLNGKRASFQSGGSFPVPVVTGFTAAGLQSVAFVPFGVILNFTPFVTDRDRVRLSVNVNVSAIDPALAASINGTNVNGLNTRNFSTTVEMREGQTLAVAGLIRNDLFGDSLRVPLLGDIPILSRLWSVNRTSKSDQELVMLVTPILVHPLDHKELPPLPGSDIFEPGDLEFYLFGRMESRRAADYRSTVRTDYARMIRYRQCEDIFINGPHGHSDGKP